MRQYIRIPGASALMSCLLPPAFAADPPAAAIALKMANVTDELNRTETGKPVQTEQKAIIQDLDELIASLEKQCQACKNGMKRNNPNKGMADSMIGSGTGGIGTCSTRAIPGKTGVSCRAASRDRILQSMSEGFPPEYRTVLERYYRRLAEEKSSSTPQAKAADETKKEGEKP